MDLPSRLETRRGALDLPAFLPDATRAVVRAVDSADLEAAGVRALMVNTLHVASKPGLSVIKAAGGLHEFMGWRGPVATDSGGFQVYSLLAAGLATVSRQGFSYRAARGAEKERLTPQSCIVKQLRAGSDLLFCLDHCTGPDASPEELRESVENTVRWALDCRQAFDRAVEGRPARPLLFAVIQGGNDLALRRECAARLLEIGFDGFGFGGWPLERGRLSEMVAATAGLVPRSFPLHGLGIGKPENLVAAFRAGYRTFDCVIPTRDARHGTALRVRGAAARNGPRRPRVLQAAFAGVVAPAPRARAPGAGLRLPLLQPLQRRLPAPPLCHRRRRGSAPRHSSQPALLHAPHRGSRR